MIIMYPNFNNIRKHRPRSHRRRILMQKLSAEQNHRCCHCGHRLRDDVDQFHQHYPTFEHLIPCRYGGTWAWDNLAVAHRCCNEYYTDRTSVGFYKYRKMMKKECEINLKLFPENWDGNESYAYSLMKG